MVLAQREPQIEMVHHVHWDPMWYSSYQEYRIRLYRLMKKLLNILETNPDYGQFMFDGQVSAIDDYLEVAPEDEEKIRRFIRDGKLAVGPWYIQPEEFLISGESLIRNLQLGIRRAEEMGGAMQVSYLCDPVGHIAQLPQILQGFGLRYFCAGRGIHDGEKIKSSEFVWESLDGSEVLAQSMPIGYSHPLPLAQDDFERDLEQKATEIASYNLTGTLLFTQGCDHGEPMEEILPLAAEHNRRAGWDHIVFTTLLSHMKGVEEYRESLPHFRGELRHSRNMPMLTGILSTRMDIKLENAAVQTGLERWLEPFSTFHSVLGGKYPAPFIDLAWSYQIRNSFHDCIYGAHADHVTPDVMHGYKQAREIIDWKTNEALYGIASKAGDAARMRLVLFNPSGRDRINEAVDCEWFFPGDMAPGLGSVKDGRGNPVPCQIVSARETVRFSDASGNVTGENFGIRGFQVFATVLAERIPAMGYTVLYIEREEDPSLQTDLSAGKKNCENGFIRVKIKRNGTVDVLDKASGQWYRDLHYFEDSGDRGDQYNYSSTIPAGTVTSKPLAARVACECAGPVKAVYRVDLAMSLPEGLDGQGPGRSGKRISNSITTRITVRAQSPVIEFHTTVDNQSRDHRLAVAFPTGIHAETVDSGSQFGINTRPIAVPSAKDWKEKPSGFWPHHGFMRLNDENRSFTFMDRGLTEHSVSGDGEVRVTLLRCTSHLSKDTLPERSFSHAGPGMPTPMGQEIGLHTYSYAVCLTKNQKNWESARQSADYTAPVRAIYLPEKPSSEKGLPDEMGLLSINGSGVMLSALKREAGGALIVRLYNAMDRSTVAKLSFFRPVAHAALTDLAEKPIEELKPENGDLSLELGAFKIVTLSVKLEDFHE